MRYQWRERIGMGNGNGNDRVMGVSDGVCDMQSDE